MSSNLSNVEILNILLEGRDLDDLTSRSLMQRWLNDEISDVQTGALDSGRYVYDLVITDSTGDKTRVVEGIATIKPSVTR